MQVSKEAPIPATAGDGSGLWVPKMPAMGEKLKRRWIASGIMVRPGASIETVAAFERRHSVSLSPNLLDYYREVDGMQDGQHDELRLTFLPLRRVRKLSDKLNNLNDSFEGVLDALPAYDDCFVFAQQIRQAHLYAVRLSPRPEAADPVFWICGSDYHVLAQSSGEFFERYLRNPAEVEFPVTAKTRTSRPR